MTDNANNNAPTGPGGASSENKTDTPAVSSGQPSAQPASPTKAADTNVNSSAAKEFNHPEKTPAKKKEKEPEKWREWVGKIFAILFMPIVFVFRPLIFRVTNEGGNPKVHFTSFSPLFYLWPVMVVGWLGILLDPYVRPEVLGWLWITTLLVVIITVATDIDRNKVIVLALLIFLAWALGYILQENQDIPVLSSIYDFFAGQNVQFNSGTANVISIIIAIIMAGVIFTAWVDGRFEITTREITHRKILRTSDSLPRAAKRIKQDWRDIAELIIGLGAGDVIVLDSQRNIVMRIPNIPFLWFFRHDVDHVLEVIATTDVHDIAAAIEEDEL